MTESEKKFLVGAIVVGMLGAAAGTVYSTGFNVPKEVKKIIGSTLLGVHYYEPEGYKYSDFDFNGTYYVHRNDKRTIVSTSPSVEGYECLGIYQSTSSAEVLFYVAYSSRESDLIMYEPISYDDLDKENNVFDFVNDLALIDENAPDGLSAFVPDNSIVPLGPTKQLPQKF